MCKRYTAETMWTYHGELGKQIYLQKQFKI